MQFARPGSQTEPGRPEESGLSQGRTWRPSLAGRVAVALFAGVNVIVPWHRLSGLLGAFNLLALRLTLRQKNLYHPTLDGEAGPVSSGAPPPEALAFRRADGRYNDLRCPAMGAEGTRFGRNFPLKESHPEPPDALLSPSPRLVSNELMARTGFKPATTLNLLAAAWIQFQTHDWFNHGDNEVENPFEVPLPQGDTWHERPMRIGRTRRDPTRTHAEIQAGLPDSFLNTVSHWWDASAIYGSDPARTHQLRSHEGGALRVENGRLPMDDPVTRIVSTGFSTNWWIGLEILHTIFALEHNAICDRLRLEFPSWTDEQLFQTARLVNAALMAKIHTVEWTPGILGHPALKIGMNANWWGLAGERLTRMLGRYGSGEIISGIPGSPQYHHGVPFSLTEEFVSVYRMHSLLPDKIEFRKFATGEAVKILAMENVLREKSFAVIDEELSIIDVLYTFGVSHPGALTLHNFPNFLRSLTLPDGSIVDLAAIDILRDRERGVPRYNRFRRLLRLKPAGSFEELTQNREWAKQLRDVYSGDIEQVDLQVGMLAELYPKGFGFGETAFRIFILMASRRIKSDRFFTDDYTPRLYSQIGLDWIARNDMTSVILRHYPELKPALSQSSNAFAPWRRTK